MEKTKQTLIVTHEVHVELVKYIRERESLTVPELLETVIKNHKIVEEERDTVIRVTPAFESSFREQLVRWYGNLFSLSLPEVLALITTQDYEVRRPVENIKRDLAEKFLNDGMSIETLLDKYVEELMASKYIKEGE
ncbi:hypothetical protein Bp8pC_207 [Bacillus phage Bp8p-C]|uniref:Uncharacterized protein n=2 Tax=Agatevirus Bp8pC TaxID=1910937 RepID=A0A0A0PLU2_9CAUD|nr:hypothetical protein AXJ20_gp141 [Bacillus phage Bp8p-C]YP_009784507.1 hypothetical protein QLX39_gp141 [Bacillus phage Bp8p-T]AHJ87637.1 hypothetical protein Bp8pC_207 [Bacillus phage Bp8p-C]AHJ87848.1 hypothetical protein Bp8pT_207 [Bacillus phage Bp8p-T]